MKNKFQRIILSTGNFTNDQKFTLLCVLIASITISLSLIISALIYYHTPRPGRYILKVETTAFSSSFECFDTTKGIRYMDFSWLSNDYKTHTEYDFINGKLLKEEKIYHSHAQ